MQGRHRHRQDRLGQDVRVRAPYARLHFEAAPHHARERGRRPAGAHHGADARACAADRGGGTQVCVGAQDPGVLGRGRAEHRGAVVHPVAGRGGDGGDAGPPQRRPRPPLHGAQPVQLRRARRGRPDDRHGLRAAGQGGARRYALIQPEAARGGRPDQRLRRQDLSADLHVLGDHAARRRAHRQKVPAAAGIRLHRRPVVDQGQHQAGHLRAQGEQEEGQVDGPPHQRPAAANHRLLQRQEGLRRARALARQARLPIGHDPLGQGPGDA
mmetsp:Transcript_16650/g.45180  ORF Transcript_16650/g.45180 Transcript_16650/m.45180 type:complete len:269 (-) Transcript_16650:739-1545(-)